MDETTAALIALGIGSLIIFVFLSGIFIPISEWFSNVLEKSRHSHHWQAVCRHTQYRIYECRECGFITKRPTAQPPLPEVPDPSAY